MLSIHFKVRKKLGGATLILHGSFRTVLHKIDLEIFLVSSDEKSVTSHWFR